MFIIESPVKGYTGISAGVGFALGKALVKELTPTQENYFRKKGYKITEDKENISEQEEATKVDPNVLTNSVNASNSTFNPDVLGAID